jgi:hypothetical protein
MSHHESNLLLAISTRKFAFVDGATRLDAATATRTLRTNSRESFLRLDVPRARSA